jgi:hypothetical protein
MKVRGSVLLCQGKNPGKLEITSGAIETGLKSYKSFRYEDLDLNKQGG